MFNRSLMFKLVQKKTNKFNKEESHDSEFVFKFYRHNRRSCIKYVVSVKVYNQFYLTLDYYPKINLTPKRYSGTSVQYLRYKMLTKQNSAGYIGGTIMEIMLAVQRLTRIRIWGVLAANLPNEITNANNKRYRIYKEVLRRNFVADHTVLGNNDNSAIFIISNKQLINKDLIIKRYEEIFAETN